MKRIVSTLIALSCCMSMATVSFATETNGGFNGAINVIDTDTDLSLGESYTFDLENVRSNGRTYEVDSDFMSDYRVTVNMEEGRSYATASLVKKSGEYKLQINVKSSSRGEGEDVCLTLEVKEKRGDKEEWTSEEYTFTIIADEDNVGTYVDEDDEYWDIPSDERHVVEIDRNIRKAYLVFEDRVTVNLRNPNKGIYSFYLETDYEDEDIWDDAPSKADIEVINFRSAKSFGRDMEVRIAPDDNDMDYLYQYTNGKYVLLADSLNRDDEFVFNTSQLGTYVMSTDKFTDKVTTSSGASSGTTSSTNASTNSAGESIQVDVGAVTISKTQLEELFKKTASGGTAVLAISEKDVLSIPDLKAVAQAYPNRNLTVVHQNAGKTIYQYRFTATQLINLQGGSVALGIQMAAPDTTKLFNDFYTQSVYVLGHHNVVSLGGNGSYAVDFSGIKLPRTNLKLYWYDATRNYFDPITATVTFDKNNYGYFTAPVGYDIVISNGPLTLKGAK